MTSSLPTASAQRINPAVIASASCAYRALKRAGGSLKPMPSHPGFYQVGDIAFGQPVVDTLRRSQLLNQRYELTSRKPPRALQEPPHVTDQDIDEACGHDVGIQVYVSELAQLV